MEEIIKLNPRNGWLGWWPRQGWRGLLDPENARIRAFLVEQAGQLPAGSKVLDGGAGRKPYKPLFSTHEYHSCDMPGGFYPEAHDFECYLDKIPANDAVYDAVVLTQVLEHVPDPLAALVEVRRVLRPGGRLLLSVPLTAPLHGEPWHFFHFTHHGIRRLADQAGYKLFKQYDPFRARKRNQNPFFCVAMNILLFPFFLFVYLPSAYLLRPLFYWLDRLDIEKSFTLGYTAVLVKER